MENCETWKFRWRSDGHVKNSFTQPFRSHTNPPTLVSSLDSDRLGIFSVLTNKFVSQKSVAEPSRNLLEKLLGPKGYSTTKNIANTSDCKHHAIMPKVPRPAQSIARQNPLAEEYSGAQSFKTKAPKKRSRKDDEDEDAVVGTKASRKILKIGRELADEDEEERRLSEAEGVTVPNPAFAFESRLPHDVDSEDETEKYNDEGEEAWGEEEETFEVEVHLIPPANIATQN